MPVHVHLRRDVFSPAPVVIPACFPVRIQGIEPKGRGGCKHICFSHSSSSLTLAVLSVSMPILCSPACPALVTSLSISLSIPLQRAGLILSVSLLPTLTVTAILIHCLFPFFFLSPAYFIPPVTCSWSSYYHPSASSVAHIHICIRLWPPPSPSTLYCHSSIFIFMSSLWFS